MGLRTRIAQALLAPERRLSVRVREAASAYAQRVLSGRWQSFASGIVDTAGDAYAVHSTVRNCFDLRADSLAAMPFRLWGMASGKRDKQFVPEHPIYDLLTPQYFRQLQLFWDGSGNVWTRPEYDGIVAKSQGGVLKSGKRRMPDRLGLYGAMQVMPVRPALTAPLSAWRLLDGINYEYLEPDALTHLAYGTDPFSYDRLLGISKLRSLAYELASEHAARGWNVNIFQRGGLPSFVAKWLPRDTNEDAWLDEDRRKAAEAAINEQHLTRNGGAMVLPGDFDLLKLGVSPREMDFVVMTNANRDRIAATFHVNPVLVGNVESAGRSDAAEKSARQMLYELAILPNAGTIERALTPLLRELAPGMVGLFAQEEVPVLRADEERTMRIVTGYAAIGVPLADLIDKHDLPYEKQPWMDDWWIGISQTTADDTLDTIQNPPPMPPRLLGSGPGTPAAAGALNPPTGGPEDDVHVADNANDPGAQDTAKEAQKNARALVPARRGVISARAIVTERQRAAEAVIDAEAVQVAAQREQRRAQRHKSVLDTFSPLEDRLRARLTRYLGDLEREVVGNLTAELHRTPPPAEQVRRILFDERNADAALRKFIRPYLEEAITIGTDGAAADLGVSSIGVKDRTTKAFLDAKVVKVVGINDTIKDDLTRTLSQGLDEGETITDLQTRVAEVMHGTDNARALRIARTEVSGAVNGGRFLQMKREGVQRLEWLCVAGDTRLAGPGVTQVARRWHEGRWAKLTTRGGRVVTVTADHQVLTRRGWIAAEAIQEGDDLVSYEPVVERPGARSASGILADRVVPDVERVPAEIRETFAAAYELAAPAGMVARVVNLDRDGRECEVEVVAIDGELRHRLQPSASEMTSERLLEYSDLTLAALLSLSPPAEFVHAEGCPLGTRGRDHRGCEPAALFGTLPACPGEAGLRFRTNADAAALDRAEDHGRTRVPPLGQGGDAVAAAVFRRDDSGLGVDVGASPGIGGDHGGGSAPTRRRAEAPHAERPSLAASADGETRREQDGLQRGLASMPPPSQLLHGDTAPVLFGYDRCVSIEMVTCATHAYDLTTATGWMIANGLIVHNSSRDDHVRQSHQELDGIVVNLGEPFPAAGGDIYFPGDPAGPPEEVISCRCTTLAVTSEE